MKKVIYTIGYDSDTWQLGKNNNIVLSNCADITFVNGGDSDLLVNGLLLQAGPFTGGKQYTGDSNTDPAFGNEYNQTQYQIQVVPGTETGSGVGPLLYVKRKRYYGVKEIE